MHNVDRQPPILRQLAAAQIRVRQRTEFVNCFADQHIFPVLFPRVNRIFLNPQVTQIAQNSSDSYFACSSCRMISRFPTFLGRQGLLELLKLVFLGPFSVIRYLPLFACCALSRFMPRVQRGTSSRTSRELRNVRVSVLRQARIDCLSREATKHRLQSRTRFFPPLIFYLLTFFQSKHFNSREDNSCAKSNDLRNVYVSKLTVCAETGCPDACWSMDPPRANWYEQNETPSVGNHHQLGKPNDYHRENPRQQC